MPSLKSLRVRINSVKSTQKITKAMKMVAASKLRRAQEAAEAARPYAERMAGILASLSAAQSGSDNAPKLLIGNGKDQVHLLIVATAERGLCGAFNSSIVKLARRKIDELTAAGKTVKILCVGKKGRDQLRRDHASKIADTVDLSKVKKVGFAEAQEIADRVLAMLGRRVRRRPCLLQQLQVGDQPDPDRAAADPGHGVGRCGWRGSRSWRRDL